jgi:hypothetical protein
MIRTVRWAALAVVTTLSATLAPPAAAQERPPVALKAEQCLRQNVDRVAAADPSLASAADFLVNYACAGEIAALTRYQRNMAYVAIFGAMAKATPPPAAGAASAANAKPPPPPPDLKAMVNPETGDLNLPPPQPGAPANPMASLLPVLNGLFGQLTAINAPPELRRLAGELVLAAHEKRAARR